MRVRFLPVLVLVCLRHLNWHSVARGTVPFALGSEWGNPQPSVPGMKSRKKALNLFSHWLHKERRTSEISTMFPSSIKGSWEVEMHCRSAAPPVRCWRWFNKLLLLDLASLHFEFNAPAGSVESFLKGFLQNLIASVCSLNQHTSHVIMIGLLVSCVISVECIS